jgi:hypothetical protein
VHADQLLKVQRYYASTLGGTLSNALVRNVF